MSKLFKLKKWLGLAEAATHLTNLLDEPVTAADILRLALDRRLTLSINFVNAAYAQPGAIKEASEARHIDVPTELFAAAKKKAPNEDAGWTKLCAGVPLVGTTKVIDLEERIVELHGVYDLPMIGGERLEIEHRFQQLTGGPAVTAVAIDGAFVSAGNGHLAQLQDHYEDNPYNGSRELKKPWTHKDNFYPGGGLPADAVLVVRTGALEEFQASLVDGADERGDPADISTRERSTLLKMLIGMAMEGYKYSPDAARNAAVTEIAADLAKHGLDVSDDTVRKYLKEATKTVLAKKPRT